MQELKLRAPCAVTSDLAGTFLLHKVPMLVSAKQKLRDDFGFSGQAGAASSPRCRDLGPAAAAAGVSRIVRNMGSSAGDFTAGIHLSWGGQMLGKSAFIVSGEK